MCRTWATGLKGHRGGRDTAFEKVRARVHDAELTSQILGDA
jgi:hypothetical protein